MYIDIYYVKPVPWFSVIWNHLFPHGEVPNVWGPQGTGP